MPPTPDNPEHTPPKNRSITLKSGISVGRVVENTKDGVQDISSSVAPKMHKSREVLSENPRKVRIHLLRHYPYMEDENYLAYLPLLEMKKKGEKMSKEQESALKTLGKKLKIHSNFDTIPSGLQSTITRILSHPERVCVVCDHETGSGSESDQEKRTVVTMKSLKAQFPGIHSIVQTNLKESDKDEKLIVNQSKLSQLLADIISDIETSLPSDVDTIVIVSNRSYVDAFNKAGMMGNLSMNESIDFFEKTGCISYDFTITSKKQKDTSGEEIEVLVSEVIPTSRDGMVGNVRAYQKAESIQSRSLDEAIKSGEKGAIIEQKTRIRKGEQEIDINLDTIIQSENSYILPAMVGSGKSLWVTSLVKKIIAEYPSKKVVFYEGGDWSKKEVSDIEDELLGKIGNGDDVILVIDAFDEIGSDENRKKHIFEVLKKLKKEKKDLKIIITGRPFEFHDSKNEEFETLALKFNRNEFIRKRGGGRYKAQIYHLFNNHFQNDALVDNPLLVFFICELANNYEKYKNLGILSLDEIITKSEDAKDLLKPLLYENIIKLMIARHEESKPMNKRKFIDDVKKNDKRFKKNFNNLSLLAMDIACGQSYKQIIKKHGWGSIEKGEFLDTINILFKKKDNGGYQFAHKSFQEYFVYQYRENLLGKDGKGIDKWLNMLRYDMEFDILQNILSSIGLMDFNAFEEDADYFINVGNHYLYILLESLNSISHPNSYSLLERIMEHDDFDETHIFIICEIIGELGDKRAITNRIDDEGIYLLKKIMAFDVFEKDSNYLYDFFLAIGKIGLPAGLFLLEKMADLKAFKKNPRAISAFCWAIANIGDPRGLNLLEKIITIPAFKANLRVIVEFCSTIRVIGHLNGLILLKEVVRLDVFKENVNKIQEFCFESINFHSKENSNFVRKYKTILRGGSVPIFRSNLTKCLQELPYE